MVRCLLKMPLLLRRWEQRVRRQMKVIDVNTPVLDKTTKGRDAAYKPVTLEKRLKAAVEFFNLNVGDIHDLRLENLNGSVGGERLIKFTTPDGKAFVLKVAGETKSEAVFVTRIINHLSQKGFPVTKLLQGKKGPSSETDG